MHYSCERRLHAESCWCLLRPLVLRQRPVHHVNRNRTLSDGRRHALHIAGANITDGKHGRKTRLKHLRRTSKCPGRRRVSVVRRGDVASGEDETLFVHRDAALQPPGARRGSGHEEDVTDVARRSLASFFVTPDDALEFAAIVLAGTVLAVAVTLHADDFRI